MTDPSDTGPSAVDPSAKDLVADGDPRSTIWELIYGQWRFAVLTAVVDLSLADLLAGGPLTVPELAERAGFHEPELGRLLRTAAAIGLVRTTAPGTYALTPAGEALRADAPDSMRSNVVVQTNPVLLGAMGDLATAVHTGRTAFAARYRSTYGYLEEDAELRREFDAFMATRSKGIAHATADAYDFTGIGTLADVGGGNGSIVATVLRANPELRGILFDLPSAVPSAREHLAAEGVADRCEVVAGDFFSDVPKADAYLLSNIVHNWGDEDAVRILANVRSAMPDGGRVLLLDMLLPDDDRPHVGKYLDMRMMALFDGGRERGRDEYLGLLREAGLEATRVIDLPYALSLIEAVPARTGPAS
ncbi:methyltransferase [Actinomadura fibrosa]|uniref:Methyltransferase n=1 Tax=Actinomadura fibrosa TaxID=111802 RepID=A0ABW2Y165_9ACTN|nr:methyltransferase [Actinomadura fibrosa]